MKAIILLSGGIDSMACISFYLNEGDEVECIFCDYGQPGCKEEYESANRVANFFNIKLHNIKIHDLQIPKTGEIFGRNALLVISALCYYGKGNYKIIIGIHNGTTYSDCTELFVSMINRVIDCYANGTVLLEAPFINWYKSDIVEYCKSNSLPISLTYSCEAGSSPPCGTCLSCLDRKEFLNE